MVRYGDVITGEMRRMKIARESRGYDPRWIWQAKAVARSAGALFVRSYERGERVYLAMASRGYAGTHARARRAPAAPPALGRVRARAGVAAAVVVAAWRGAGR